MTRDYGGRRPQRGSSVLPTGVSRKKPPAWPLAEVDDFELGYWRDLWSRPVAHLWRSMHVAPLIVARYVRVLRSNPASASLTQMESALGLTPAALRRLQVTFEEPSADSTDDDVKALLDAAVERWESRR